MGVVVVVALTLKVAVGRLLLLLRMREARGVAAVATVIPTTMTADFVVGLVGLVAAAFALTLPSDF